VCGCVGVRVGVGVCVCVVVFVCVGVCVCVCMGHQSPNELQFTSLCCNQVPLSPQLTNFYPMQPAVSVAINKFSVSRQTDRQTLTIQTTWLL